MSTGQQRERNEHDERDQRNEREEHQRHERSERGDDQLERLLRTIDPPGREVSDDELRDPGRAIPDQHPTDNRS